MEDVRPFGLFYCHLVYCMVILVYFSRFGMLYQEKSGNPAEETRDLLVSVYFNIDMYLQLSHSVSPCPES
jgi:hypothetical protein